ncbi:glycosyltransferase [bacterium]|nr:MAG: glycosyltransferase [bacterium]
MTATNPSGFPRLEGGKNLDGGCKSSVPGRPLVSIITVVLNGKDRLKRTVESVLSQSYDHIEYIVIDGGSDDGSVDVLRSLGSTIDYWVSELDKGIAAAFNKGIALARGEIIGLLNAGDLYERNAAAAVVDAYLASPRTDVFCGSIRLKEAGAPPLECNSSPSRLEKETSVYHPTTFVKRTSYERYGPFDEGYNYAMDYELLLRFRRSGASFYVLKTVLAEMELDGISATHWRLGLNEVRRARAAYFSPASVAYHHSKAVLLNIMARGLKKLGMLNVYRAYWRFQNLRTGHREKAQQAG